jgi:hypothetical protein
MKTDKAKGIIRFRCGDAQIVVDKSKRILNPVTGTYYTIKQRSSKYKKGEVKGLWNKGVEQK